MRDDTLTITTHQGDSADVLVLELTGPLLCNNLFDFQQTVRSTSARGLVVDMTQVPYVDSAGVGALVGAYVSFQKDDKRLALVSVNDRVQSLFSMTQVEQFFRVYDSVEEAEVALGLKRSSFNAASNG